MVISSQVNGSTFSTLALHTQAQQVISNKLTKAQSITRAANQSDISTENWIGSKWQSLQPGIATAIEHLETVGERIGDLRTSVETLLYWNDQAATATASQLSEYVGYFDAAIRDLNAVANSTAQIPNLLGATLNTELSYTRNFDYDRATVAYGDISTAYYLVDSGNNLWRKDDASFGTTLTQYDSSGVATGKSAAVTHDVRLDSFSGSTATFTIHAGTSAQETIAGATLVTSGLGITDSWLYGGLATSSGRALADTALRAALVKLDARSANINSALSVAKYDSGIASVNAEASGRSISSANLRQMIDLQESGDQFERDSLALSVATDRNRGLRAAYLGLLRSRPIGSLIDVRG
jgi:hypothetical protein